MAAGLLRLFYEEKLYKRSLIKKPKLKRRTKQVAVCIAAHNEEKVIAKTIRALKKQLPSKQIFVASDGSIDKTASIARNNKCRVLEFMPGRGKAGALAGLIDHFDLLKKYKFILFIDAEVKLGSGYIDRSLAVFETRPAVVAIAGYVRTPWRKHQRLTKQNFIKSYRVRLNRLLQSFLVYGQTWRLINTPIVIPGGCSIYRSDTLGKIEIDTPGLLIEDFNLTFQVHKKRLGKIALYPGIYIYDGEPVNFKDYWNQIRRWNIGFLQTVRKQGIWLSFFWIIVSLFTLEVFINALAMVLLPVFLITSVVEQGYLLIIPVSEGVLQFASQKLVFLLEFLLFFFILDYLFTLIVVLKDRKPMLAIYGLGFLLFRFLDSLSFIVSIPQGLFTRSRGRWVPPKRT